jgi:hypothetical protein
LGRADQLRFPYSAAEGSLDRPSRFGLSWEIAKAKAAFLLIQSRRLKA